MEFEVLADEFPASTSSKLRLPLLLVVKIDDDAVFDELEAAEDMFASIPTNALALSAIIGVLPYWHFTPTVSSR